MDRVYISPDATDRADQVVWLYESILGRQPSIGEIRHHVLEDRPLPEALRIFVASEEAANRVRALELAEASPFGWHTDGVIRHVAGLGTHCFTSSMLKRWSLKRYSLPFDWIFSSPGMIAACLDDGLAMLLDTSQYEAVPTEARPPGRISISAIIAAIESFSASTSYSTTPTHWCGRIMTTLFDAASDGRRWPGAASRSCSSVLRAPVSRPTRRFQSYTRP